MACMALCNAVWFQRESGSRFVVSLIVMQCRLPAEMMFGGLPLKEPAAYGGRLRRENDVSQKADSN